MIYAQCQYCETPLTSNLKKAPPKRNQLMMKLGGGAGPAGQPKAGLCPKCKSNLPRCSICLQRFDSPALPLAVPPKWPNQDEAPPEPELPHPLSVNPDLPERMWVLCLTCRHGAHAACLK